jgi:hypothetical protein
MIRGKLELSVDEWDIRSEKEICEFDDELFSDIQCVNSMNAKDEVWRVLAMEAWYYLNKKLSDEDKKTVTDWHNNDKKKNNY